MLDEKHGLARGAPAARNLSRAISATCPQLVCTLRMQSEATTPSGHVTHAGFRRSRQRSAIRQEALPTKATFREGWAAAAARQLLRRRHLA